MTGLRIGVDLGGTKIAAIGLGADDAVLASLRQPTPRHDYGATIEAVGELVHRIEQTTSQRGSVGIGIPGSLAPSSGRVQNANSTWLNGQALQDDLEHALARPVRLENDANCFALSEARDGAGRGARTVFGAILGTGCGGGIVIDGYVLTGAQRIGGEWGHTPLPWPSHDEHPGPKCWCGRPGCLETWVSGIGLARDHEAATGDPLSAEEIVAAAGGGDAQAQASVDRHSGRLARGLATVVNILDPDVIVLGGGLSALPHLYEVLPGLMRPYVFCDAPVVRIAAPRYGGASGVRGAACLW